MSINVLITGATGMVGSHLAEYLLSNTTWKIHCLVRWRSSLENLSEVIHYANDLNPRIIFHYGDLNDSYSVNTAVQKSVPDYVFHLAAQSFPQMSFDSPNITYLTNIIGTENLLSAVLIHNKAARVHVCSSSEVFGRVPKEFVPISEDCRFHPASPYAISKVGTDLIGQFYAEAYNLDIYVTRMFTHTGPRRGDVFAESTFAKQIAMIENNLQKPVIKVGNLDSLRTFADVRDAVRAYYYLLTQEKRPKTRVFNIGGNYTCTVGQMLEYLMSISTVKNIKIETDESRIRPIDADLQVPNLETFKSEVDWEPEFTFEDTMKDLLNYWRDKITKTGEYLNR